MKDTIKIKQLRKKDFKQAMIFAEEGMHLSWYVSNKLELYLYRRYAFYDVLLKSTTVLGAYSGDYLVGFLFAAMSGEPVVYSSIWQKLYCSVFSKTIEWLGYGDASNAYEHANKDMLEAFLVHNPRPDGELTFFAVNPKIKGKGIGTKLLNEFKRTNKHKLIYLYSDSGSTYQFYLRRGFKQAGKKDITLICDEEKQVLLTCYLFSRRL